MIYSKTKAAVSPYLYLGTRKEVDANYIMLGESVNMVLDGTSKEVAASMIMVIDTNGCKGSTGLNLVIQQQHPECAFRLASLTFSAAARFGFASDEIDIYSAFSTFRWLFSEVSYGSTEKLQCFWFISPMQELMNYVPGMICIIGLS
ncbi:hypothetical protein D9756_009225 [Leucocoprinus leucothites]|uniref:Uncharacterized protein n=1 Tax=Leucocoprinus leucothites TaxID=201217 RepID=A0A8H5CXX1_9AGAR|nr:hypothetical protein D9756_009225 [Leucoagaricus leucothites]